MSGQVGACNVEVGPVTSAAGEKFSVQARVVCTPPCDREGERITLFDQSRKVIGTSVLGAYDGEGGNCSEPITLMAPNTMGPLDWTIVVPACDAGGVHFPETTADCAIMIEAHKVAIVVWDNPSTVVAGETFSLKVGIKCSAGCEPNGWTVRLTPEDGRDAVEVSPKDVWQGTKGLHYSDVQLMAPADIVRPRWAVSLHNISHNFPHDIRESGFSVHCTARPECRAEIKVLEMETQEPVPNATVQLHPFRVLTDANGVARIAVPKGSYNMLVSGTRHIPYRATLDILEDMPVAVVELAVDRELTEADIW